MIVDKIGDYRTRDGRRAYVFTIDGSNEFSFPVKGSVYKMFRGKERPRGYEIWTRTGQVRALGEHGLDLVEFIA